MGRFVNLSFQILNSLRTTRGLPQSRQERDMSRSEKLSTKLVSCRNLNALLDTVILIGGDFVIIWAEVTLAVKYNPGPNWDRRRNSVSQSSAPFFYVLCLPTSSFGRNCPSICFMRWIVCFHENFPGSTFLSIKANNWRCFSTGMNHKVDSDCHVLYFTTCAQLIPVKGENFLLFLERCLGINNRLFSLLRTIDDIDAEAILIQWFPTPMK